MSGLRFACGYRPVDPTAEWTCDRHAAGRERGTSKCLGHWVVDWILTTFGGNNRARRTYSLMYGVVLATAVGQVAGMVIKTFQGKPPEHLAVLMAFWLAFSGFIGGVLIALALEHASGGILFLACAPLVFVTTVVRGITHVVDPDVEAIWNNTPNSSALTEQVSLLGLFVWALVIITVWLNFVMHFLERYRWATRLTLFTETGIVVVALTAVALAITSGGEQSSLLISIVVGIGVMAVLRGATRIAKLFRRLRV